MWLLVCSRRIGQRRRTVVFSERRTGEGMKVWDSPALWGSINKLGQTRLNVITKKAGGEAHKSLRASEELLYYQQKLPKCLWGCTGWNLKRSYSCLLCLLRQEEKGTMFHDFADWLHQRFQTLHNRFLNVNVSAKSIGQGLFEGKNRNVKKVSQFMSASLSFPTDINLKSGPVCQTSLTADAETATSQSAVRFMLLPDYLFSFRCVYLGCGSVSPSFTS